MSRLWWALAGAIAVLIGVAIWERHQASGRQADIARRETELVHLRQQIKEQTPIYIAHTDTFTKVAHRYDTMRVYLDHRITDTMYVKELIATADTTIRMCRVTLADCERLRGLEKARADTAEANATALKKQIGGPFLSGNLGAYKRVDSTGFLVSGGVRLGRTWAVVARGDVELPNLHANAAHGRGYIGVDRKF